MDTKGKKMKVETLFKTGEEAYYISCGYEEIAISKIKIAEIRISINEKTTDIVYTGRGLVRECNMFPTKEDAETFIEKITMKNLKKQLKQIDKPIKPLTPEMLTIELEKHYEEFTGYKVS